MAALVLGLHSLLLHEMASCIFYLKTKTCFQIFQGDEARATEAVENQAHHLTAFSSNVSLITVSPIFDLLQCGTPVNTFDEDLGLPNFV